MCACVYVGGRGRGRGYGVRICSLHFALIMHSLNDMNELLKIVVKCENDKKDDR